MRLIQNNRQAGAATLLMSLVIVSLISMLSIHAAQTSVIEQKISINHMHTQQAFEIAEIGFERVRANINRDLIKQQAKINNADSAQIFYDAGISIDSSIEDRDGNDLGYFKFQFIPEEDTSSADIIIQSFSASNPSVYPNQTIYQKITFTPLVAQPPLSAIIAKNDINIIDETLSIKNLSEVSSIVMWSGGEVNSVISSTTQSQDQGLDNLSTDDFFNNFFTESRVQFRAKSKHIINCTEGCNSDNLISTDGIPIADIIWIDAYNALSNSYSLLSIENSITLGTLENPVLIIVDGYLQINHRTANITGLIYTTQTFNNSGEGNITGALISEQDITLSGKINIHYDHLVIENLIERTGKFTRVAGSWRDF